MEKNSISLKACPIILREKNDEIEVLSFQHPLAGKQIVKGTIDPGEDYAEAALRELHEESGIDDARVKDFIGNVLFEDEQQSWHIYICETVNRELPESWSHTALEGDGNEYNFSFFWHKLSDGTDNDWHYTFRKVLEIVNQHIQN